MRLEFFLENVHEIAPLLSKLYADVLAKGHMTPSMCHAILSPPSTKIKALRRTELCTDRSRLLRSLTGS